MIIFDSSTIILLSKIEILELFVSDFNGKIFIPEKVKSEVCKGGKGDSQLILGLIEKEEILVREARERSQVIKLMEDFNIDDGEAEVLTLALQENVKNIATDDRNAIKACKILKIDFVTAIAILIRTFEKNLINEEEAMFKLEELKIFGRYSNLIIEDAINKIKRSKEDGN